ncbi:MAG: serine/threonine-protein kinase, partial [Gemmataceae bacterium]
MSHQPHQDEPTIATGEYVPQERPEPKPGEATGEFLPEPETSGARTEALTGEFQPVEAPDATGEYLPESPLPQIDVDVGARTEALTGEFRPPEAPDAPDATGEYRPEASAGAAPAPDQTVDQDPPRGDATGEFISGHPRGGTIRGRGGDTGDKIGRGATADPYTSSPDQSRFSTLKRKPDSTQGGRAASSGSAPLQLSRYDMKTLAGKGGMGEVWLADDGAIGRPVAIKRMIKGRADQRDRFLMEAQITGQLEHPGVVPVHELGLDDNGQPYYVMKFVQGATLQKVINEYHDPKTPEADKEVQRLRLLSIFLNLCQTIAYSHSRKIIHRDIKPENVMTGAYGETLVLDWGLAKTIGAPEDATAEGAIRASGADTNATMMGAAKGTPTYFSPEAAAGLVHEVDQLSDIYLLGATLYHILTGKPPRHATKIRELIEMAKNTPPAPPRSIKPDVPKPLEAICMKAMAHDRKDRYRTATELAEDMQRYLAGEPVTAYKETFLERTWRWAKKHHKALGRGVAGLLVAAGALVAFLVIQDIQ